ncbi:MAG: hypothetical protein F6K35_35635, partial [Okeania sp. SIO2H7]|nr:hypothetical protein [Okeania sp. SIO2H7]
MLTPQQFRKYATIISATTITNLGGLWLWRSLSTPTTNLTQEPEKTTLPSLTLSGHKGWVYAVAISPDGKTMASSGYDGTIKIWNFSNGQLLNTIDAHKDAIESL